MRFKEMIKKAIAKHRNEKGPDSANGGVVKHFEYDLPKEIESKALTRFYCKTVLKRSSAIAGDRIGPRTCCFTAEYKGDKVICFCEVVGTSSPRRKREFIGGREFMDRLGDLIREHRIAHLNGRYHSVSGLPRFFGSTLKAEYLSGEILYIYDNQSPLLDVEFTDSLCRLFGADI